MGRGEVQDYKAEELSERTTLLFIRQSGHDERITPYFVKGEKDKDLNERKGELNEKRNIFYKEEGEGEQ